MERPCWLLFTITSVPYGALGDSLTRDVNELTILTSVRMIFANFAGLLPLPKTLKCQ
ncbi:MAG: hypothetical protein Q4A08_05845 [Bacteroidales bacterium]|nr:hypothetical protein [Bacteroidales bacterium]